jgi:hypothetical protein
MRVLKIKDCQDFGLGNPFWQSTIGVRQKVSVVPGIVVEGKNEGLVQHYAYVQREIKEGVAPMEVLKAKALDYFRRLVSLVYREVGVLSEHNHPAVYSRAKIGEGFFGSGRKRRAAEIYAQTVAMELPQEITRPYLEATGLSLEQVESAFSEGEWRTRGGYYAFGGPRWASITAYTIALGRALDEGDWCRVETLLVETSNLRHNNGFVVDKFADIERQLDCSR